MRFPSAVTVGMFFLKLFYNVNLKCFVAGMLYHGRQESHD